MSVQIEGLEFKIQHDSDDALKGIDALSASLGKLKRAVSGLSGLDNTGKVFETINSAKDKLTNVDNIEKLATASSKLSSVNIPPTIADRLNKIGESIDDLTAERSQKISALANSIEAIKNINLSGGAEQYNTSGTNKFASGTSSITGFTETNSTNVNMLGDSLGEAKSNADNFTSTIINLQNALNSAGVSIKSVTDRATGLSASLSANNSIQNLGVNVGEADSRTQEFANTLKNIQNNLNAVGFSVKSVSDSTSGLRVSLAETKDNTEKTSSALRSLKSESISIGNAFKAGLTSAVMKFASPLTNVTSMAKNLFSSLKRIAMYRVLRTFFSQLTSAMKEGINNLYQYSALMGGTFKSSMDSIATSLQYLKNSLGAMVSPIINALAPALDYLIDKFVSLINVINRFFAALTGASTYTVAKKAATTYADTLEDTASSASSAAKEITDAVTGIDELNIISQNDNTSLGSSGSSDSTDYASMFEEISIPTAVSDFANQLKEALLSGDWESLGTLLGEKVNEIIDSVDWSGWGEKVGYAINGGIQTAYYFLDTVNFTNIGSRIAEFLNAALDEIDFTYAGRLLVKELTILPDLIIGFITGLDWKLVAASISDFFKGAFGEVIDWLNSYNWSELGNTLWQKIKDIFTNIDFTEIVSSWYTALGTAYRSVALLIGNFFAGIGSDIKAWWDSEIVGQNWQESVMNLLKAIGQGYVNFGFWEFDTIINSLMNALLGENNWTAAKDAAASIWNNFVAGLKMFFSDPTGTIKKYIIDPIANIDWSGLTRGIFSTLGTITRMAIVGIVSLFGTIWDVLSNIDYVGIATSIFSTLGSAIKSVITLIGSSIKGWWDSEIAGQNWLETASNLLSAIGQGFLNIGSWVLKNIVDPFMDALIGAESWSRVKEVISTIWNAFVSGVKEFFSNPLAFVIKYIVDPFMSALIGAENWSRVKEVISIIWNAFITGIKELFSNPVAFVIKYIVDPFMSALIGAENWSRVKEVISIIWNTFVSGVKEFFSNPLAFVVKYIVDPFMSALIGAESWSRVKEVISIIWNTFVSGVKEFFSNPVAFIKENIVDPFINGIKNLFSEDSVFAVVVGIGGYIVEGLYNGIKNFISSGSSIITGWASSIINWFTGGDGSGTIFEKFTNIASNIVTGFKDKISSTYSTVSSAVTTWASNVKSWFTTNVNSSTFATYASNIITGFKDKVSSTYTNIKTSITTWGSNVLSWFTTNVNSSTFSTYANNIITGFKSKISSAYTNAKTSITTWASNVKTWFTNINSSSTWSSIAGNIISGFISGITSLASNVKNTITGLASNVASWFKSALGISSPSKLFYEFGDNTVSGFNNAIESVGRTTKSVMTSWTDSFTDISPTMSIGVDTSALDYYDSDDFAKAILSNVEASTDFASDGFKQALDDFFHDYLEETLLQIADDTRRQADKEEQTVLRVNGRKLASTLESQTKANGYSFAT